MLNAKLRLSAAMPLIVLSACTAPINETAVTEAPAAPAPAAEAPAVPASPASAGPLYVSDKNVSTDCGIGWIAPPPPGFAPEIGGVVQQMPPLLVSNLAVGADRPMVETDVERVAPGYVIIEPGFRMTKSLIDIDRNVVATFQNDYLGFNQLLPDGSRLASSNMFADTFNGGGGERGCVEEYGPDGALNWRLRLESDEYVHHHDVVKMPNGNVLALVWERVSAQQAIELGRNPEFTAENGDFWFDGVVEVNPATAEIVWEWSARHHVIQDFDPTKANYGVVADHPERLDINKFILDGDGVRADWTHANALDYNAELDQIIWSSNYLSEVYVIDHSTTPYEAQRSDGGRYGKGGNFLFRWGNPANYNQGGADDRTLFNQHDVQWIRPGLDGAGNLMIFNNGHPQLRRYTTVVELAPAMNADGSYVIDGDGGYAPVDIVCEYAPTGDEQFFSHFISGVQRLPNGNTLVNQGAGGRLREVTREGDIVWEYRYQEDDGVPHMLFRAYKYPPDHPGVQALLDRGQ